MQRIRTCIGCAAKSDKTSLFRIVRDSQGLVLFDKSGKMQGRGAYVCSSDCFEKVSNNSRLSSALRCKIDDETYSVISRSLRDAEKDAMNLGEE